MKVISTLFFIFCVLAQSPFSAQETKFTYAEKPWNGDEFGNIRAIVQVRNASPVAFAKIDWRRRDLKPEDKNIIVTDESGKTVKNVKLGKINREFGEIYFEPISWAGKYFIYYLPYKKSGSANYPKDFYPKFVNNSDADWLNHPNPTQPNADVLEIQSIDVFDSFYPMEIIATAYETQNLIQKNQGKSCLIFPEDRMNSIKMTDDLPQKWMAKGPQNQFSGDSKRGEFYAFQLGVFALKDLKNIKIDFSDLKNSAGNTISKKDLTTINLEGIDYLGRNFSKNVDIQQGKVQAFWCGVDVAKNADPGIYKGTATVSANRESPQTVEISLNISNQIADNDGANEPEKMTRLKWLNSKMAQENTVIAPYTAINVKGNELNILGRKIILEKNGLPKQILSYFTPEMTSISNKSKDILQKPIQFEAITSNGNELEDKFEPLQFTKKNAGTTAWKTKTENAQFETEISGQLEFDGFMTYQIKIIAKQDIEFQDIKLNIPFNPSSAKYMMGLGEIGQKRPDKLQWKWEVATKNQDGAWLGDVNAGLQYSLRDENYVRPLNTNFYLQKPLLLPTSWGNSGKGGINIYTEKGEVLAENYSGKRSMKKGETLYYNFNLLITPFHPIDTDWQWENRFYHRYAPISEIKKTAATVINIHHATAINPYINYPFIERKAMKSYIDDAHKNGLKVKIYNTIRELSNHAYELPALRSLNHEIFSSGKGGGFSWLQEHQGSDYIAAWFVPEIKDAAIVNSGVSRWHNYYVEGMNWLVQNVEIDGIYLDDVAYDRSTMKRIKRVLTKDGHPGIIDLHSANQFNKSDGYNNSAMLYMEHFPYLNKLWFGEYFDYENNSPDFFLTEVSGIPFGLMGEMLQDGGNKWRGMVYGMTSRMPWTENANPQPIWKVWDDFGMKGTEMYGYWSPNVPVKSTNKNILATVYKKKGKALISIASWAPKDETTTLEINWKDLGIHPKNAKLTVPQVEHFQEGTTLKDGEDIRVPKNKGLLIVVEEK